MFTNAGLDPGYGITLPHRVTAAGLNVVRSKATMHLCRGHEPMAKVMAESALVLRDEYRSTGGATDHAIDRYVELARDPHYWSMYYSTVSVIAQTR